MTKDRELICIICDAHNKLGGDGYPSSYEVESLLINAGYHVLDLSSFEHYSIGNKANILLRCDGYFVLNAKRFSRECQSLINYAKEANLTEVTL